MEQCVKSILQRWQRSLSFRGTLDEWSLNEDYSKIEKFLRGSKNHSLNAKVARCRDLSIKPQVNDKRLSLAITKALNCLTHDIQEKYDVEMERPTAGQRERYHAISKSLGKERVRQCKGQRLRNLDVTILNKKDSKLVRRIVEKRMCQEYHRQHKSNFHTTGNRTRQNLRRAVSYQLYNLGQLEGDHMTRDFGTHWKWKYDRIIQTWVLKKKVGYNTYEDALNASMRSEKLHKETFQVYQCDHCKKYHIGHAREDGMEHIA